MPARFRPVKTTPMARSARPRVVGGRAGIVWVFGILLALSSSLVFADFQIRPMIAASAQAMARRAATAALNDAVTAEIAADADFSKIVHIDREKDGKMVAAHIDFAAVTDLQAAATERADSALRALAQTTLRLPWTQVVGGSLFTTFAPSMPVRMTLFGDAHSSVQMDTRTEGVNQSVHTVYLVMTADVGVVSPFVTAPVSIDSHIPIAYFVLTGDVPNTFVSGGQTGTGNPAVTVTPSRGGASGH